MNRPSLSAFFLFWIPLSAVVPLAGAQSQSPPPVSPQAKDPAKEKEAFLENFSVTGGAALDPQRRGTVVVKPGERSPFGASSEEAVEAYVAPKQESEEMRLRRVLGNMRVSGLATGGEAPRVLLGNVWLRQGDKVPQMFSGQSEVLTVGSVSENTLLLMFEEKDKSRPPRSPLALSVDLRPSVRSMMPGDLFMTVVPFDEKGQPALEKIKTPAVAGILDQAKEANMGGLVERTTELLGVDRLREADNVENSPEMPRD